MIARDPTAPRPWTPKERQVCTLLCRGLSFHAIAAEVGCQERTVQSHVAHLQAKTGARNRYELAEAVWRVEKQRRPTAVRPEDV